MTNKQRRDIIEKAKAEGFEGNYVDLFRSGGAALAVTPEQREKGLRPYHDAGDTEQSMVFPNTPPNTPFNTVGMKKPIRVQKVVGDKVVRDQVVPPGVSSFNTGSGYGTVIEAPELRARGQYGRHRAQEGTSLPGMGKVQDMLGLSADPSRPTISQESVDYETPKTSLLEMAANPLRTSRYYSKAIQADGLGALTSRPTTAEYDATPSNAMDTAIGVVNPAAWGQSGIDAVESLREGDYTGAAVNALGVLPGVGKGGKLVGKSVKMMNPATVFIKSRIGYPTNIVGRGIQATNSAFAQANNVAQNLTKAAGQSKLGQTVASSPVGQGAAKVADVGNTVISKTKAPFKKVMDAAANTKAGRLTTEVLDMPSATLGGSTSRQALKAYGSAYAATQMPKLSAQVVGGDITGAANTFSKLPVGKKVRNAVGGLKQIAAIQAASEGVSHIASGDADAGDLIKMSKLLPGTSNVRIGYGLEQSLMDSRKRGGRVDRRRRKKRRK